MLKKVIKIVFIVIMLLGIAFSISNFISVEIKSAGHSDMGIDYDGDCISFGFDCDLLGESSYFNDKEGEKSQKKADKKDTKKIKKKETEKSKKKNNTKK